jgi:hypothetical protein
MWDGLVSNFELSVSDVKMLGLKVNGGFIFEEKISIDLNMLISDVFGLSFVQIENHVPPIHNFYIISIPRNGVVIIGPAGWITPKPKTVWW